MQKELNKETMHALLQHYETGHENIIKALHELQDAHPQKYISKDMLEAVSAYLKLTKAQLYGIVSYYSMFSLKPRQKYIIRLCHSPVCRMMGAEDILKVLEAKWHIKKGNSGDAMPFYLETVECLGRCGKAPSMMINENVYSALDEKSLDEIINAYLKNKD